MVATVRSARNSLNPGEKKGLGVMINTSQWTSDSLAPLCYTLHPHETGVRMQITPDTFSKQSYASHPPPAFSGGRIQLFCAYFKYQWCLFTTRKVLLWSGCWRHSSVAEYMCVLDSFPAHSNTRKRNQTLLQGVFAACPHQVHVCSVLLLSFHDRSSCVSAQGCGCDRSVWGSDPGSWWPAVASHESAVRICWKEEI